MSTATGTTTTRWVRTALALALAGLLALLSGGILLAVGGTASANPGTDGDIKVGPVGTAFPADNPSNEPHIPTCDVRVWFYGYEEGDLVTDVTFEAQAPTGAPQGIWVDWAPKGTQFTMPAPDSADNNVNTYRDYTLSFTGGGPQEQQGYHAKVDAYTQHVDDSGKVDDGHKYKVFWVTCEPTTPTETPTTPTETPTTPTETPTTPTETPTTPTQTPTTPTQTPTTVTETPTVAPSTATQSPTKEPVVKPTKEPTKQDTEEPEVLPAEASQPPQPQAQVPTTVDAGFAGWTTTELLGASLVGGGLALLASSGAVLVGVRRE